MVPASLVVLHGGPGVETTALEYLVRVVLYLFAFGSIAAAVFWGIEGVSAVRSRIADGLRGGKNDP